MQHLGLFVPWDKFLTEASGDINETWMGASALLPARIACLVENVQLLRRSAEDAKRDAKQWAASSGDGDPAQAFGDGEELGRADDDAESMFRSDEIGNATRLIDVFRSAAGPSQVTAESQELKEMTKRLCRFQESALSSNAELEGARITERQDRCITLTGQVFSGPRTGPKPGPGHQVATDLRLERKSEHDPRNTEHD